MTKETTAFKEGYWRGYEDAMYLCDTSGTPRDKADKQVDAELDQRLPNNELYVTSGCGCANAMYCDGACFPKAGADWK